jgi:ferrochelatase
MPAYAAEPEHHHGAPRRTGVLLVNLGTPAAPTAEALRRYLKQFLWDPRVVEVSRPFWWLFLHAVVLTVRPKRSAAKYQKVWTEDGSPLKFHTERQAKLLRGWLGEAGAGEVAVGWAMRYGEPSIDRVLDQFKRDGVDRVLVVPLYPQFAASTSASVMDAVADWLKRSRNPPELRFVKHFNDDPGYIGALAATIGDYWAAHGRPDRVVMSFHGLPSRSLDLGDPYYCECHKTGRLLAEALGLGQTKYIISFQSRFGAAEWLQSYTQPVLEILGREGTRRVDVICPGFVSDCLETLEEIAMECRAAFLAAGGQEFHYIPCLNEQPAWIAALRDLVITHLAGWPLNARADSGALERAKALGAKT